MKRLNIARKFYPRLRYIRINISRLLAALLQIGVLQSSMVQGTALPVVMAIYESCTDNAHSANYLHLPMGVQKYPPPAAYLSVALPVLSAGYG